MMASHSFSASPPVAPSTSSCPSPVHVYVAGVGDVGAALLRQIDARGDAGRDLRVIGACTSRRAAWGAPNRDPEAPLAGVDEAAPPDWPAIVDRLAQETPRPLVFVDATGSPDVADYYEPLLRAGVHVVTPSKLANTRSQAAFDRLREAAAEAGVQYRYETTVGAGLPVVQTVRNLVATGDRVRSIRGVVSGTLTFLFSALRDGSSFSEAVRAAVDRGYAEPDVRDDLSGTDVARKFLILARTAGYAVEPTEVQVESLVPDSLADAPYEAFLDRLSTVDPYWRERSAAAAAESAVLQYVGRFSPEGIEVGVEPVPGDTALGQLGAQENLFEVTTDRYAAVPLVVRGPGAGPSVTAAGVLADVLTAVREARPPSPPA
ncbi:aspartate kinase [Salinibacter ruber]|uniref:aspartate kinase n=2 Tax=Salinibacter ruber TaxID=146919 RepID=UPI000E58E6EB|nr:aspartate kinase [Salinibacter ruber]MCS3714511.1 aspartokinase/homoserine dehydrogenase 1 [Salinibacter ruber]MCS3753304.1 aspartokinase/homoserine dehydrogenase 1 [Salinibacter ruber]